MNRPVAYRCRGTAVVLIIVLTIITMLVLARPGAGAQAPATAPKANADSSGNAPNGKRLYTTYGCYQCHGREAQGGPAGPRLARTSTPFTAFVRYNRQPLGQMPPYTSKVVKDSELADIYAFLQSLPQPPAAKSIPLLND